MIQINREPYIWWDSQEAKPYENYFTVAYDEKNCTVYAVFLQNYPKLLGLPIKFYEGETLIGESEIIKGTVQGYPDGQYYASITTELSLKKHDLRVELEDNPYFNGNSDDFRANVYYELRDDNHAELIESSHNVINDMGQQYYEEYTYMGGVTIENDSDGIAYTSFDLFDGFVDDYLLFMLPAYTRKGIGFFIYFDDDNYYNIHFRFIWDNENGYVLTMTKDQKVNGVQTTLTDNMDSECYFDNMYYYIDNVNHKFILQIVDDWYTNSTKEWIMDIPSLNDNVKYGISIEAEVMIPYMSFNSVDLSLFDGDYEHSPYSINISQNNYNATLGHLEGGTITGTVRLREQTTLNDYENDIILINPNGDACGWATLTNGTFSFDELYDLPNGTYTVSYKGTTTTFTITNVKITPTVSLSILNAPIIEGDTAQFLARVTYDGIGISSADVKFKVGNTTLSVTYTDENGYAYQSLKYTSSFTSTMTFIVEGSDYWNSASTSITVNVLSHNYDFTFTTDYVDFSYDTLKYNYVSDIQLTDNGKTVNTLELTDNPIILELGETSADYTITSYDSSDSYPFFYPTTVNDSTTTLHFTATWNGTTKTVTKTLPNITKRNTTLTATQEEVHAGQQGWLFLVDGYLKDAISNTGLNGRTVKIYEEVTVAQLMNRHITVTSGSDNRTIEGTHKINNTSNNTVIYNMSINDILSSKIGSIWFTINNQGSGSGINVKLGNSPSYPIVSGSTVQIWKNISTNSKGITVKSNNTTIISETVQLSDTLPPFYITFSGSGHSSQLNADSWSGYSRDLMETVTTTTIGLYFNTEKSSNVEPSGNYNLYIEFEGDKFYNSSNTSINWTW